MRNKNGKLPSQCKWCALKKTQGALSSSIAGNSKIMQNSRIWNMQQIFYVFFLLVEMVCLWVYSLVDWELKITFLNAAQYILKAN